jgi:hypothetical protein
MPKGHGISLQPEPVQRGDVTREVHMCRRAVIFSISSRMSNAATNANGKRLLSIS